MKIAILIYDGFTALDAIGPYEVLSCLPGAKVYFVSTELGPKRAHTNFLSVMADYALNDISDPEIILVPGGTKGTMVAAEDPRILSWLRKAHETSKWTTSVCTGSLILGAAGVSSGIDMALHLAKEVSGPEMAKIIQLVIEYDPKPPFDSGSIAKAEPSIVKLANQAAQDAFK